MNPKGPDRLPVVCSDPVPDLIDDLAEGDEGNNFNEFNEKYVYLAPQQPDGSPNVGKLVQNLETVVQIPENHHELQEKANTLDERAENFEFGIRQSGKISDLLPEKSADLEKFIEKLNNFSNKTHSLPRFDGFMQNFGYETNNFIHLAPFDN